MKKIPIRSKDFLNLSKNEIEEKIKEIFSKRKDLSPKDIKKIKKIAMSKNIRLKDLRKRFCKKCYSLFNSFNCEIRIKKGKKIVKCKICGYINRWKLKNSS